MRKFLIVSSMLLGSATAAIGQVNIGIGIGLPGVSIGINLPAYPDLVPVPGYPVYYAPRLNSNFFFYDGMYWVYQNDDWYASSWYNGPWGRVGPEVLPSGAALTVCAVLVVIGAVTALFAATVGLTWQDRKGFFVGAAATWTRSA